MNQRARDFCHVFVSITFWFCQQVLPHSGTLACTRLYCLYLCQSNALKSCLLQATREIPGMNEMAWDFCHAFVSVTFWFGLQVLPHSGTLACTRLYCLYMCQSNALEGNLVQATREIPGMNEMAKEFCHAFVSITFLIDLQVLPHSGTLACTSRYCY